MRYPWATLKPRNVPQQFCAAPLGNALPLFRRWRVRIDPVSNKLGDTFSTLGRHYKPISFPNRAARHPRATLRHFFVAETYALIPSRISPETPSAMPTPLGDITSLYRSTTVLRDTLGQHYSLKVFPNRAARHSRATLLPQNVPQQGRAISLGDIKAPKCSLTVLRDTLGRHYKPKTFPNRTALHLRATLRHIFVAETYALIPS